MKDNCIKCIECGSYIENKIEDIDLCSKCDEKNWITDPIEIGKEILKDKDLSKIIYHVSSYENI